MMTCYRNLSKHFFLKITKPKPIGKCCNMIFNFCKSIDFFFSKKKVIKYSLFIFIVHICAKSQTEKNKRLLLTCVSECFQSHCHTFKELHEFLMCAVTIGGETRFIFSFVRYGLVRKSLGVGCTFQKMAQKTKCPKMNVNLFIIELGWIISPSF